MKKYSANNGPLNKDYVDLLTSMLSSDLKLRPASVDEVLEHPYFTLSEEESSINDLDNMFKALVGSED